MTSVVNDERGVRIFRVLDTVKVLQESTDCGWRVVCEGDESGRFLTRRLISIASMAFHLFMEEVD